MLHPGSLFAITGNEHVTHIMPHTTLVSGVCEMFVVGILFVFMAVQLDFGHCVINTFTLGFVPIVICSRLSMLYIFRQWVVSIWSSIVTVMNHCHSSLD